MKLHEVMLTEITKPTYRVRGQDRLIKLLHEFLLAKAHEWSEKTQYAHPMAGHAEWTDADKLADSYERLTNYTLRNLIPEIKEKSDELAREAGWNRD